MLSHLSTKSDIEALAKRIEQSLSKELEIVKKDIASLKSKTAALTADSSSADSRLSSLEKRILDQERYISNLYLQTDDAKNRNSRNKLRIRSLPEATGTADLATSVTAIFNTLLDRPASEPVIFDRVHRALGPRGSDPGRPRDVICRLHYYMVKESILRRACKF